MTDNYYTSQKARLLKESDKSVSRVKEILVSRYGEKLTDKMIGEARQEY